MESFVVRERCLEKRESAKPWGSRSRCRAEKLSGCGLFLFFFFYRNGEISIVLEAVCWRFGRLPSATSASPAPSSCWSVSSC